jgi:hypothetical protein
MEGFIASLVNYCSVYDVNGIRENFACAVKLSGESFLWRLCDEDEKTHEYKCFNADVDAFCRRYVDCFECDFDVSYLIKVAYGTLSDQRRLIAKVANATSLYPSFVSGLFGCNLKDAKDAQVHVRRELEGLKCKERVAVATLKYWGEREEKRIKVE